MGTMITTGNDVITFLKAQHDQVSKRMEAVLSTHGSQRGAAFVELRRLLAVHETAEEEIVHPAARRALSDGQIVVEARLREEAEAKTALLELEELDVDAPEFEVRFRALQAAVQSHAQAEERTEFVRLGALLDPPRLERMKKAAVIAEAIAPTRPHPGVQSPLANLLVGPFASMMDRARDALAGKVGGAGRA